MARVTEKDIPQNIRDEAYNAGLEVSKLSAKYDALVQSPTISRQRSGHPDFGVQYAHSEVEKGREGISTTVFEEMFQELVEVQSLLISAQRRHKVAMDAHQQAWNRAWDAAEKSQSSQSVAPPAPPA